MKVLAAVVLGACLLTTLLAFQRSRQYEYEMQTPPLTLPTPTKRPSTPSRVCAINPEDGDAGGAAVGGPTQTKRSASLSRASAD